MRPESGLICRTFYMTSESAFVYGIINKTHGIARKSGGNGWKDTTDNTASPNAIQACMNPVLVFIVTGYLLRMSMLLSEFSTPGNTRNTHPFTLPVSSTLGSTPALHFTRLRLLPMSASTVKLPGWFPSIHSKPKGKPYDLVISFVPGLHVHDLGRTPLSHVENDQEPTRGTLKLVARSCHSCAPYTILQVSMHRRWLRLQRLASMIRRIIEQRNIIYHVHFSAAPRAVAPIRACRERAMFCTQPVVFAV